MFENRITALFPPLVTPNDTLRKYAAPAAQVFPMVSLEDVYNAAFAKARSDHELDKLFNPEYYGDHGSGI